MNRIEVLIRRIVIRGLKIARIKANKQRVETLAGFIKFCMIGFMNTVVNYFVYAVLTYVGLYYIASSIIAFFVSSTSAFIFNRCFVFRCGGKWFPMLIKTYCSYGLTGIVIYNGLLYLLTDVCSLSPYLSPFPVMLVTVPLNYILNKNWTFAKDRSEDQPK